MKHIITLFALIVFIFPNSSNADNSNTRRVLLLNSYSYDQSWTRSITDAITESLDVHPDIKLTIEFMDTKRHNSTEYYNTLLELYQQKYKNTTFSAVVTSDDNATNFALNNRDKLFPDTPIIFCGVNNLDLPLRKDFTNITGTLEVPGIRNTIDTVLRIHPNTDTIYFINESNTSGTSDRTAIEKLQDFYSDKFTSIWIEDKSDKEMRSILSSVKDDSIILLLSFFTEKESSAFKISEGARFVSQHSPRPVYSMWEYFLGNGIVGGMLTSGRYQGELASDMLLKVLSGIPAADIPIISESSNKFMFDYKQMIRFGITEEILPQDSIIINKPSSLNDKFRQQLIISVSIIFILLLICFILIINIRARHDAEKALKSSEARFRAAFDSAKDCIVIWDKDYRYLYANTIYSQYFGLPSADIIGEEISEVLAHLPEYMNNWKSRIDTSFSTGESLAVHDVFTLNDIELHSDTILTPIVNDASEVTAVCFVCRDATERISSDKHQRELEEQLQQSEKMKSIGYLAGGVAHDFNNILGGIIGAAEMIQRKNEEDSDSFRFSEIIINTAETAAGLTRKLLAFARKQKKPTSNIEVNSLVSDTIELLKRTISKNVSIDYSPSADANWIIGDSSQLQNVIINLGINAEQAMPDGGTITISTRMVTLKETFCKICNRTIPAGDYIEIEVRDTGCGIPEDILSKIFDPFYTTKEQGKGTGLGLSAVYGTIQQHKGSINIISKEDIGTSFKIYLPVINIPKAPIVTESTQISDVITGNILLIDDEQIMLQIGSTLLEELGFNTVTANNAKSGIEIFKKAPTNFDLIILDMIMPAMNGKECFYILKDIRPDIKIILASGYSKDSEIDELERNGLSGHIQKPYKSKELSKLINNCLLNGQ